MSDKEKIKNIGAVIVARMTSSRFPGKSMVDILGKPSLEWLLLRLSKSSYLKNFVIATTTNKDDDVIDKLAERLKIKCYRGSEDDVLSRVYEAAKSISCDIVVHLTGDCPLIDSKLVDRTIEFYLENNVDYASLDFDAYANGFDVEVFSFESLEKLDHEFKDPWVREHVTEPLYTQPELFKFAKLPAPPELDRVKYRICIDTKEDYQLVKTIFSKLLPQDEFFDAYDIMKLLDDEPELVAVNAQVKQKKYQCGVIGLGNIGAMLELEPNQPFPVNTHAAAFLKYGKTKLKAVCDISSENLSKFSKQWDFNSCYTTAKEMFENENLDVVSIATPIETHADLCLQAINAGVKAIFCEKPFVCSLAEGENIIKACTENKVKLFVNHWMRWGQCYQNIKNFINDDGLGKIQSIRCHYCKGVLNSGTHAVDLIRYFFGNIDYVQATENMAINTGEDNIGGILRTKSGIPIHLTVSDYRNHFFFEIDIIGEKGRLRGSDAKLEYFDFTNNNFNYSDSKNIPPFSTDLGSPFESAVAEIVDYLDGNKDTITCSGEDGLKAVATVSALKESWAKDGTKVYLDSARKDSST